jgi:hypothetical protein
MRTALAALSVVFVVAGFLGESGLAEKKNAEARLGGLLVIAQSIEITASHEARFQKPGFHDVRFRVVFRNISKQAICISFRVSLESTFNIGSRGSVHFDDKGHVMGVQTPEYPDIHELLPGKQLESDVVFAGEKDGVDPLMLVLTRSSGPYCGPHHSHDFIEPARIPVKYIPIITTTPTQP